MTLLSQIWSKKSKELSKGKRAYDSCATLNIKTFYDIINQDNLRLLIIEGNYSDDELEDIWEGIYDEYCNLLDDGRIKQQISLRAQIHAMKHKYYFCVGILDIMANKDTTVKTLERCYTVLKKYGYILDRNKEYDKQLESLARRLAHLQTHIELKKKELGSEGKKQEVRLLKSVVKLRTILKIEIDLNKTSVEEWIFLNKEALEQANGK